MHPNQPQTAVIATTLCAAACALAALIAKPASAGGGPENVFLVYNSASDDSTEIARFYAGLRHVPEGNLLGIDWRGSRDEVTIEEFRQKLLLPILRTIDERRLGRQIDYLIYSSDFPWRVNFVGDLKEKERRPEVGTRASLTGATYLYQFVRAKSPAISGLRTNWYMPPGLNNIALCKELVTAPSRGFRAQRLLGEDALPIKAPQEKSPDSKPRAGIRYLLSTMLAVTTQPRGNTVEEVKRYLKQAALADNLHPDGVFYFSKTRDVRSKTRHECYGSVVKELRALGARAEVVSSILPRNADDALGVMCGSATYDLQANGVRFLRGAIGDNLTSVGGSFSPSVGQTPLSSMLRHGAAGASGTVVEPLAIQAKFALPSLFVHYRRGCSLAEAYYQSVSGPYQLLIVGDPLCQPWARRPRVSVPGFPAEKPLTGDYLLKPVVLATSKTRAKSWRLFVDGRLVAELPFGATLRLTPGAFQPGRHDLRVVAIGDSPIESQGRWESAFVVPKPSKTASSPRAERPPSAPPKRLDDARAPAKRKPVERAPRTNAKAI